MAGQRGGATGRRPAHPEVVAEGGGLTGARRTEGTPLDRGAAGAPRIMEWVAERATRYRSSPTWSRELVPELFVTVLSLVASKRSGGRAWG